LGGLISNDMAKDIDRDPEGASAAKGNPLFNLLRSKAFRNKKSQFVVFITPRIITDAAADTADIKNKIINTSKNRKRSLNM
jgi:Flp pilus assembly secretin CpaC